MTLLLSLLLAAAAPRVAPAADASIHGIWWNSDASVAVDVEPCGNLLCGTVTHAEKRAELDARKGGYDHMVGLRVMYGFEHVGQSRWKGTVLIPERKMNVRSTLTRIDAGHIKVEGCILGFLCSHEIWRRTR